ncbi:MAG: hypothetical protein ABJN14_21455 [Paracoccaceae bacterium]
MSISAAIKAVGGDAPVIQTAIDAWNSNASRLIDLGINNDFRRAMLIGQCGHESAHFKHRFENLNYSGSGLWRVFRKYFKSEAEAAKFHRQPERIANRVYSDRNGNGNEASGEGWKYRGRGYLQLTGKANYKTYGKLLEIDLVNDPDKAADPEICWLIAAQFCGRVKRSGRTLLDWVDAPDPDVVMVTLGINGGRHGLADRKILTAKALAALTGDAPTSEWQALLLNAGFNPGPVDGLDGPKTRTAQKDAERQFGLTGKDLLKRLRSLA